MITASETQQDYLETILTLSNDKEGVRIVDISHELQVSPPSVVEVVSRLKEAGFVEQPLRGLVSLTEKGKAEAIQVYNRHEAVRRFFSEVLRLPAEVAEEDACKVEHAISKETYDKLCDFLEHLETDTLERDNTVPLTMMRKGEQGTIKRIVGGSRRTDRLSAMGVRAAQTVRVLQNVAGSPVMIEAGNSRLAIGRGLATCLHILLTPVG
jgi:DtxR family Mn-dependent transcriptional regulator